MRLSRSRASRKSASASSNSNSADAFRAASRPGLVLTSAEIPGAELAAGEAAEEIEPGEVGVGLEAAVQARLRRFEPGVWI